MKINQTFIKCKCVKICASHDEDVFLMVNKNNNGESRTESE